MADVGKFVREVRSEAQKTNWPTRAKLFSSAGIVLLILIVTGVYFWFLDLGFSSLTTWLLSALGIR